MNDVDFVVKSEGGDELIRISSGLSVNVYRTMIDNIDSFRTVIQKSLVEGLDRCWGCGAWGQEHDSGSGFGHYCSTSAYETPVTHWSYKNSIEIKLGFNDSFYIEYPDKKLRDTSYVGKTWLKVWPQFVGWLNERLRPQIFTISGDLNKLTSSEESQLRELIHKMNK